MDSKQKLDFKATVRNGVSHVSDRAITPSARFCKFTHQINAVALIASLRWLPDLLSRTCQLRRLSVLAMVAPVTFIFQEIRAILLASDSHELG